MDISRYDNSDSGYDHFTHEPEYDNNNSGFNKPEISATQYDFNTDTHYNSTNSSNISQSSPGIGQFYAFNDGSGRGHTFHMNVVNENCVYEPTGYSKKIIDLKIQPCNDVNRSRTYSERETSSPRPESLHFVNQPQVVVETLPDCSSGSSSVYSDEDDHSRRKEYRQRVENHYMRLLQQEKLSPNTASALSDAFAQAEEKAKYSFQLPTEHSPRNTLDNPDIGIDKQLWRSIDRERNKSFERQKSAQQTVHQESLFQILEDELNDNALEEFEDQEQYYDYQPSHLDFNNLDSNSDKSLWRSVDTERDKLLDRQRSYETKQSINTDVIISPEHNSSKSSSTRSRYSHKEDFEVSDRTKPYIEMTHKVRDSSSNPSGYHVFEEPQLKNIPKKQDSFSKSQPNSPVVINFPPRAFSARGSVTSERSSRLDPHTYQSYAAGILYSTGKSEQYLKLQKHFAVLERISEIEHKSRNANKCHSLPRSKLKAVDCDNIKSQYEFDKDDELIELYGELEEAKKNKEFYYNASNKESFQWNPDQDHGLLKKEKSLGDLRSTFIEQEQELKTKPAFSLEDEIRREKEFIDLYKKYKKSNYLNEDEVDSDLPFRERSSTGPSYLDIQERENKRSYSRPIYGSSIEKPLNSYEVHVQKVTNLSKSEPNINRLHVRCMSAPTKKNASSLKYSFLQRSDSSKESFFGIGKQDEIEDDEDYAVEVGPDTLNTFQPFQEELKYNKNPLKSVTEESLTYTGSRIKWNKQDESPKYDFKESMDYLTNREDKKNLYKPFSEVNADKTGSQWIDFQCDLDDKLISTSTNNDFNNINSEDLRSSNKELTTPNKFTVKDLRGLAENNEFSQSKFGQLRRAKSLHEVNPSRHEKPTKKPVPLPPSKGSIFMKDKPPSPTYPHYQQKSDSKNSSDVSDEYIFKYTDLGNNRKSPLDEKLELMQKLNDERSRGLDKTVITSLNPIKLETSPDALAYQDRKYQRLNTTNSLKHPKRSVSGNSIFHKQSAATAKTLPENEFYAHPPAYSSVMEAKSKPNKTVLPRQSDHGPTASRYDKYHSTQTPLDNEPPSSQGSLRRWQPQNLTERNNSVSSNYVHSSTETFIVNSDEDLSVSQSSSNIGRRWEMYPPSTSIEKAKSEPDLNMMEYDPKRPRSAKSQIYLDQDLNNKRHWRRTLGNEYVNEPVNSSLPRTLSGDLSDVRKKWENHQWNPIGRQESSESQTSLETNLLSSRFKIRDMQQNYEIRDKNYTTNITHVPVDEPYDDSFRNQTNTGNSLSKYDYDPYIPSQDILKEVTSIADGTPLTNPIPRARTPSSVSRMTLDYFDQLGGEWKIGSRSNSSIVTDNFVPQSTATSSLTPLPNSRGYLNTSSIYSNSHTTPVSSVRERLPTYGGNTNSNVPRSASSQIITQSLPTQKFGSHTKPIPSKRSDKIYSTPQYYRNGNITDQDKIMHSSVSNPMQSMQTSKDSLERPKTPQSILRTPKPISSKNQVERSRTPQLITRDMSNAPAPPVPPMPFSQIPPPPNRRVPPVPRRKVLPASKSPDIRHQTVAVPGRSHSSSIPSKSTITTSSSSIREWTPAHVKTDEQYKGSYPNAQNTNLTNVVVSNSEPNLTRYQPEATSKSQPISPSNVPSPPARTHQSPTIKPAKLRMPRSSLSAVEQLGVKNPPLVKTNENGAFKHQTSDVIRSVPMSEKERRRKEEDKLYRRQRLEQLYEEERKRKALQEEQDIQSRRHNDFFMPSMKSPISNDRFNETNGMVGGSPTTGMTLLSVPAERRRGFQIQGKARAKYTFNAQNARELSFRKGDIIYLLRQIDKNWFEGDRHGTVGIFPVNYVEVMTSIEAAQAAAVQAEGQGRVKYNFTAQSPVELSLRKGEYVTLLRTVDENWYEGRSGNKQGIFPAAYIEIIQEPSTPLITPAPSVICTPMTGRGTPEMLSPVGYDAPTPPPQPSPSAFNQSRFPATQFGYRQQQQQSPGALRSQSNPLSPINQELEQRILGQIKPQLSPTQPKKQVTINTVTRQEAKPVATKPSYGVKSKVPDDDLAINRYRAIYMYKPQNEDELELQEGDEIYVMEQCDDGWYVGTSGRTGNFGTFPGNYVQLICKYIFLVKSYFMYLSGFITFEIC